MYVKVAQHIYFYKTVQVKVTEFFGGVRNVELTKKTVNLTRPEKEMTKNGTKEMAESAIMEKKDALFTYQKQFPTDLINHLKAQQKLRHY